MAATFRNRLSEYLPATLGGRAFVAPTGNGKAAPAPVEVKSGPGITYPRSLFWLDEADRDLSDAPLRVTGAAAYGIDLVWQAAQYLTRKITESPPMVVRETDDGEEYQRGHWLDLLLDTPNDDQDAADLFAETVLACVLADTALWKLDTDRGNRPARITVYRGDEFGVKPKDGRIYGEFTLRTARGEQRLEPEEVVYFRPWPHPTDRWRGYGPLSALAERLGMHHAITAAVRNGLTRNARPGASLTWGTDIPAEKFDEYRNELASKVEGIRNNGRTFLADNGGKLEFHDHDLNKLGAGALSREVEAAVAASFGVPPVVLGFMVGLENAPWSHIIEARKIAYNDGVVPIRKKVNRAVTRQLLWTREPDRTVKVVSDTSQVAEVQQDDEARSRVARMNAPWWTKDELRVYTGQEPLGDERGEEFGQEARPAVPPTPPQGQMSGRPAPESKATKDDTRKALWQKFDALAASHEADWREAVLPVLEADRQAILAVFDGATKAEGDDVAQRVFAFLAGDFDRQAKDRLRPVASDLTARTGRSAVEQLAGQVGVGFDLLAPGLERYTASHAAWLVTEVTDTTKQAIRDSLQTGLRDGESTDKLRARIAESGQFQASRAELIARTETTTVSNGAQRESMSAYQEASGDRVMKQWLATQDGRTREEHLAMDGEEVGIDQAFSNGLDAPGEPNCRCTMVYRIERGDA